MNNELKKYFLKLEETNKISHSFILGNTSLNQILDGMNEILSKYIYQKEVDISSNPDIYVINPENNNISKEQIKTLQLKLSLTSIQQKAKVYIINNCELLNEYAANSLLKILEEPSKNIYAFLITKNIETVIPTIKSRCQVIFLSSESNEEIVSLFSEKEINKTIEFINLLEEKNTKSIAYIQSIQKSDRETIKKIFNIMLYIYRDSIDYYNNQKTKYFHSLDIYDIIIKNNDLRKITDKLLIINDILININYNLNINLLIDKFIIDFGGEKYD